jgi:CRISPR/Cas system-associated protein endoribonuclease Cas2
VSIETELQGLLENNVDNRKILQLESSIDSSGMNQKQKQEAKQALENLNNKVKALKYDVKEGYKLEKNHYFSVYERLIKHLYSLDEARKKFRSFNEEMKNIHITQMVKLLDHLDTELKNPRKASRAVLEGRADDSEHLVNLAIKKGFLDSSFEKYNPWQGDEEFQEILVYDEELAYDLAMRFREKAFEYGKKALRNRPVLYLREEALMEANAYYREKTKGEDGVESGSLFEIEREEDQRILIESFEVMNTNDSRLKTKTSKGQDLKFRGESGRDKIFCHSHTYTNNLMDRLSEGDIDKLKKPYDTIWGAGLREGITLLALPHADGPFEEDILWLACAVNSEGYAGNYYLHVVREDGDDLSEIDGKYSWVNIHNKWIRASYASYREGPYTYFVREKELQKIREQIQN